MKKGEKRKKMLLTIAYDMFLTQGYENTSVDEIIEIAQIAKGTYYYYFQSKEQMLEEVIDMMIDNEAKMAKIFLPILFSKSSVWFVFELLCDVSLLDTDGIGFVCACCLGLTLFFLNELVLMGGTNACFSMS